MGKKIQRPAKRGKPRKPGSGKVGKKPTRGSKRKPLELSGDIKAAFNVARSRAGDPEFPGGGGVCVPLPGPNGNRDLVVRYDGKMKGFVVTLDGVRIGIE